jgi:hypothetical protein
MRSCNIEVITSDISQVTISENHGLCSRTTNARDVWISLELAFSVPML